MTAQLTRHTESLHLNPGLLTDLPPSAVRVLQRVTLTNHYPTGAVLFNEGQPGRGIYVVERGRVKLSVCASDGRTMILRIVEAGEAQGVAACIGNREYEATAEAQGPCDVDCVRQSDVVRMMRAHREFAFWITQHLSYDYNSTCQEIRKLMLSRSASERLGAVAGRLA